MQATDLLVEVRNRDLIRVAQIVPERLDIRATIRDCAPGEWTLRLPVEDDAVGYLLAPGAGIIVTGPGGVLFSGPVSAPKVDADLTDPTGIVTFTGTTDDVILWNRLAYPTPTTADVTAQTAAYDVRSGAAETVMRAYVEANLGASAPVVRRVNVLTLAPDLARGGHVSKSARFDVLGDLLAEIATVSGLRFRVAQSDDTLLFEVLSIADRRGEVRFDLHNGTLSSTSTTRTAPAVTRAIVAGQGEGELRTFVERTTVEATEAETDYGAWGRIETFVDQRQTDDAVELQQAGDKALADAAGVLSASAVASDDLTMRYALDWNVGDLVALVVGGDEDTTTVSAATIVANSDGIKVGAVFGDIATTSASSSLNNRVTQAESRLSALERNAEQPTTIDAAAITGTLPGSQVGTPLYAGFPGEIRMYAGATAPPGWAICDGSAISRTTYSALFAVVGTTYGAGNGSTTFNLPNLKGRVPLGVGDSGATGHTSHALGSTGGEETHTLTVAEMPAHSHTQQLGGSISTVANVPGNYVIGNANNSSVTSTGGGGAHNNLQPFTTVNFVIRL